MNPLDLYAVPDVTSAEEAAYDNAENRIAAIDGKALYESDNFQMDGMDGMFDMYGLPDVFSARERLPWVETSRGQQRLWGALADAINAFAYDRLDYYKVADHADDLAA